MLKAGDIAKCNEPYTDVVKSGTIVKIDKVYEHDGEMYATFHPLTGEARTRNWRAFRFEKL